MAGGYDIGVSVPISSSAGAALSGAKDQGGTTNFGTNYGPGSLIITDQAGSIGASAGGSSLWLWLGLAAIAAAGVWLISKFLK